jgi:hypothetical protein
MTREIIVSILQGEGAETKAGALVLREDREASCFVSAPGELLAVGRIIRVELKDTYLALQTAKDERFVFAFADILGFKFTAATNPKDRSAGFGR